MSASFSGTVLYCTTCKRKYSFNELYSLDTQTGELENYSLNIHKPGSRENLVNPLSQNKVHLNTGLQIDGDWKWIKNDRMARILRFRQDPKLYVGIILIAVMFASLIGFVTSRTSLIFLSHLHVSLV